MALYQAASSSSSSSLKTCASLVAEQDGSSLWVHRCPSTTTTCLQSAGASTTSAPVAALSRAGLIISGHRSCTPMTIRTINGVASKPAKSPAEEDWKVKREMLLKNKVRSVSAKEALQLQQNHGYIILDVRPNFEFKEAHAKGAINVELYRLIKEWTPWDITRRLGFAFFGIFSGTEENPKFLSEVVSQLEPSSKIIVACSSGGTMKPSPSLSEGQQSRSLIAAYILILSGYKNVLHLEGGLRNWFKEELPAESNV